MESFVKTFEYDNGEIQRVQAVAPDRDAALHFFKPQRSKEAFDRICDLYRDFAVPRCPYIFGRLMHFCLPDDVRIPEAVRAICRKYAGRVGLLADDISKVAVAFKYGLHIKGNGEVTERKRISSVSHGELLAFYKRLADGGFARVVCGKAPYCKILPVGQDFGLLSASETESPVRANSTFFIMDSFDVASVYDVIGTPFGFTAENGDILTPPLYGREAFVVRRDGSVGIETPRLKRLIVCIDNIKLAHGEGGVTFYERPDRNLTPRAWGKDVLDIAVIGRRIAAVKRGGRMQIPAAGFVIRVTSGHNDTAKLLEDHTTLPGMEVTYSGIEDVNFAVSAGNPILINGEKILHFITKFYNIKQFWCTKYPPSLYPLDFNNARAPRMAIGADKDGEIMLVWAEGKGKFSYEKGKDSCGASLKEMAEICEKLGLYNAVNLDGGGSAQLLVNGKRKLMISDRNKADNSEAERAVPLGIAVAK